MSDTRKPDPFGDAEMEALFHAARDTAPAPSEALVTRILDDAAANRPRPAAVQRQGWLGQMLDAIGGWPAAAGLAAATVAGVTIGVVTPEALEGLSNGYLSVGTDAGDFLPSYAALLDEG